jgi:hypothetical protein
MGQTEIEKLFDSLTWLFRRQIHEAVDTSPRATDKALERLLSHGTIIKGEVIIGGHRCVVFRRVDNGTGKEFQERIQSIAESLGKD